MKNIVLVSLFALLLLSACIVTPGPSDYGGVTVSPLPSVVVLGADPYYYQNGYFYFYQDNNWRYSKSRSGPWYNLPRSHWPKEIRHRDRNYQQDGDRNHDDGRDNRQDYHR
jgi:hypothetical protein